MHKNKQKQLLTEVMNEDAENGMYDNKTRNRKVMTPKEKAKDLVEKMAIYHWVDGVCKYEEVKQCALIAVDEILLINVCTPTDYGASWTYWEQVKQEIEKL